MGVLSRVGCCRRISREVGLEVEAAGAGRLESGEKSEKVFRLTETCRG